MCVRLFVLERSISVPFLHSFTSVYLFIQPAFIGYLSCAKTLGIQNNRVLPPRMDILIARAGKTGHRQANKQGNVNCNKKR